MSIKTFKPTTPSRRHMTVSGFDGIDKHAKPESSLTEVLKKNAGRNSYGRITVRHHGGGPPLSCAWSTIPTAAPTSLWCSMRTARSGTSSLPWV